MQPCDVCLLFLNSATFEGHRWSTHSEGIRLHSGDLFVFFRVPIGSNSFCCCTSRFMVIIMKWPKLAFAPGLSGTDTFHLPAFSFCSGSLECCFLVRNPDNTIKDLMRLIKWLILDFWMSFDYYSPSVNCFHGATPSALWLLTVFR